MAGMGGGIVALPDFDREEFAERKRLGADYLAQIARATVTNRQELIVEWAEKLYDAHAQRRTGLVKSWGDFSQLRTECQCRNKTPAILPVSPIRGVGATWAGTR
jgi:hypothetical protein